MSNRSVNVELPDEVWKVIDTQFKPLSEETDSEILCNIIRNHLAQNGYYPDADSLMHGNGLKEVVETQHDMIMSVIDLFEKKGAYNLSRMGSNNARKNNKKYSIFLLKTIK